MSDPAELHAQQVAFWNGPGGERWVAGQAQMEAMLAPVADALIAHASVRQGETVLDVGCGYGVTALVLAQAVGPKGRVIGLDVSAPMLALARARSAGVANIEWIEADAATHAFAPASVDLVFSRFGVMFFGDPAAAFANLRRALRPGGRLVFACWRTAEENPWIQVPAKAVFAHVPPPPRPGPEDPGMLSFGDPARVRRILTQAGFGAPRFTKLDLTIDLGGGQGLEDATAQALSMRPVSEVLLDQPDPVRAAAVASVRAAL
ncbi:MAG: class I SAM-dependent methyltransferase, partial [Acetobacteraceae bacterium]|nr:class I SAM-dependent methyltransferase [Acetobacteraceae bacterium]